MSTQTQSTIRTTSHTAKKSYHTPTLNYLGTVVQLTQSAVDIGSDAVGRAS